MRKNIDGFSLTELIVVIVILAVIIAIAFPYIIPWVENSRRTVDVSNAQELAKVTTRLIAIDNEYAGFHGDIILDEELNQLIEFSVEDELGKVPIIKTYRNRYFIITVTETSDIIITDDVGYELFPHQDKLYQAVNNK